MDAVLLARAVISLENVNIRNTGLTQQQTKEIFNAIRSGHSQLKDLDIGRNNLSLVEPALLARAVTSLEIVNLSGAELTTQQLEAIFTTICAGASWLKTLCLASTKMYLVDSGLLAKAVNRLKVVYLSNLVLLKQQAEAILTESLVKTSLSVLDMNYHELDEDLVKHTKLTNKNVKFKHRDVEWP